MLDVPSDILLIEQVGRGTYGSVYAAEYRGQRAAVKAVPVEAGPDGSSMCADLQREIKMLKTCDSEWIVKYYGCLQKARTLWIAMELCDGSVADVLRVTRTPLTEDELACVAAAIVRGLVHLHVERHILHRDIKAGNVLLSSSSGGIKLCDLGVSASIANHTKRSTVIGTPLWMSPELIESGAYGTPPPPMPHCPLGFQTPPLSLTYPRCLPRHADGHLVLWHHRDRDGGGAPSACRRQPDDTGALPHYIHSGPETVTP